MGVVRNITLDSRGKALSVAYKEIDLNVSRESFELKRELTDKGSRSLWIYKSTLTSAA